jgi:hypothetical protein
VLFREVQVVALVVFSQLHCPQVQEQLIRVLLAGLDTLQTTKLLVAVVVLGLLEVMPRALQVAEMVVQA